MFIEAYELLGLDAEAELRRIEEDKQKVSFYCIFSKNKFVFFIIIIIEKWKALAAQNPVKPKSTNSTYQKPVEPKCCGCF